jgi:four helix bundle protein
MTGKIRNFQDLEVWQRAHQLVLDVYRATRDFPADEGCGLAAQTRKVAVSVPANIAAGFGRRDKEDKIFYYSNSEAYLEELKYYLILSEDLGHLSGMEQLMEDAETITRMLGGLVRSIESRE